MTVLSDISSTDMDGRWRSWFVVILFLTPVISNAWRYSRETDIDRREYLEHRDMRPGIRYHTKRHMLPPDHDIMKRTTTAVPQREKRKKPTGRLTPLEDDYIIENDEEVSVAVGPPPMRSKFDRVYKKIPQTPVEKPPPNITAINFVTDVLREITKEFLTRDVNENFVFGQYVGNAMKNLTNTLRLNMQHDILDLIMKYQKRNNGEVKKKDQRSVEIREKKKDVKIAKNSTNVENDENWPDFSNLEKIVG